MKIHLFYQLHMVQTVIRYLILQNLGDNLIIYKTLLKYVQEDETFNERFEEYALYFKEGCHVLRSKFGQVNSFFPITVWFWFICCWS